MRLIQSSAAAFAVLVLAMAAQAQPVSSGAAPAAGAHTDEQIFMTKCGICHSKGGTGTMMLAKRLGAANALLAERKDLNGDYIEAVVRNGLMSMPTISRVEVTNAELAQIKRHLLRNTNKTKRAK